MNTNDLMTGVTLTIVGMGIVFAALFLLNLVIKLTGLILGAYRRSPEMPAAAPTPTGDTMDADELSVLAAAIAVALAEPVRIHHIRMLQDEQQAAWSRIGRLDLMRSHSGSGRQG